MGWNIQAIGLAPKEEGGVSGCDPQAKGLDLKKKVEFERDLRFTCKNDESLKSQLLLRLSLAWSYT